jgi:hypothetical protein
MIDAVRHVLDGWGLRFGAAGHLVAVTGVGHRGIPWKNLYRRADEERRHQAQGQKSSQGHCHARRQIGSYWISFNPGRHQPREAILTSQREAKEASHVVVVGLHAVVE